MALRHAWAEGGWQVGWYPSSIWIFAVVFCGGVGKRLAISQDVVYLELERGFGKMPW